MSAPVFRAESLSYSYEQAPALRGVSFEIHPGESVALIGANGSGKSTLLRILDALAFPTAGSLSFDGTLLSEKALQSDEVFYAFRRRVALVFQNPDVQLFNPTVFDEIAFGPLQMEWKREEVVQRVEAAMAQMAVGELRDRPPYRLSGGEKKRVALASVLVLQPEVLLLDEPTAMLDPRSQSQLIALIQQWKDEAKTVITATHQLELLEDFADRVLVMEHGQIIADGPPDKILADGDLLLRANLVHAHRHHHGKLTHAHPHVHSHHDH